MSQAANRILVVGLIAALLSSGMALGIALDRFWLRPGVEAAEPAAKAPKTRGKEREKRLLARFQSQLNLNEAQTRHAAEQIHLMFKEVNAIRRRSQSDLREARAKHRANIMAVLNPEQRQRFESMIEAYEKRRASRHTKGRGTGQPQ